MLAALALTWVPTGNVMPTEEPARLDLGGQDKA
jgi:hypothetical protein